MQAVKPREIKLDKKDAKDLHDLKVQSSLLSSQLGNLQYDYEKKKMAILVEMERTDKRVMQIMAAFKAKYKIIGAMKIDVQEGKLLILT